jgi:hypothetical protein
MKKPQYLHINYIPEVGWVLSIMSRLLNSANPQLRSAFDQWSDTPLKELGFAITTRMHMLGLCIRRLNARVGELRKEITTDISGLDACLEKGYAFGPKDTDLPYELLLDMDAFIFETRSLYEIMGKFLKALCETLFGREIEEAELIAVLLENKIDTRWIAELRENRILFFHQTAPWLAVQVDRENMRFDPILLKRSTTNFNPDDMVEFATLREIYEGFVESATELHRFIMEQITRHESETSPDRAR